MRAVVIALLLISPAVAGADELANLRLHLATHFLNPEAHLQLSKYLLQRGDRLTAFFVSEAARREYFGDEQFDRAFAVVFREDRFDNGAEAEKRLANDVAAAPDDSDKRSKLADVYLSKGEWKKAEAELRAATKLAPENFRYIEVLGEVLRRDNRTQEAEHLLAGWQARYPTSVEAYRAHIEELSRNKSPEIESVLDAALSRYPDDADLHFQKARLLHQSGNTNDASKEYVRAADLDKTSATIQGWTGRFFLKSLDDKERALEYYLTAYFLDPHFYDTEYAEGRVRSLAYGQAAALYHVKRSDGVTVGTLLHNENPVVVGLALDEADQHWSEELIAPTIQLLSHDDPGDRNQAAIILGHHLKADDVRIDRLLQSTDLRMRGSAAYVAGALRGVEIIPVMQRWLTEPAELLQYDAISVLAIYGGSKGHAILLKLRASGTVKEPRLRAMLDEVADSSPKAEAPQP